MTIGEFVNLYRNSGYKIKTICGNYFQSHLWKSYSWPLNYKINVNDKLVKTLKWRYLITTIFTKSEIKNANEYILETTNYDIENFDYRTKKWLRKSLQNCSFRRPSLEDLLEFGLKINRETCKRQHRRDRNLTNSGHWKNHITTLYNKDDIIILAAYYQGRMVGYLDAFEIDGIYSTLHGYIDRKDSEVTSPMMGLIYTLVSQIIKKNGSVKISYGLETLNNPRPDLSRFKRHLLFKPVPVSRAYLINPLLLTIFKLIIFFNIKLLKRKRIKSPLIKKIVYMYQGNKLLARECKKYCQSGTR